MRLPEALLLLGVCAWAQPSPKPLEFDVASIRPGNPESRMLRTAISNGRLSAENATLRVLVEEAYDLKPFQLTGGPPWMDSEGFKIMAQGDSQATNAQVKLMLRSLLKERFQLSVRIETKEQQIYVLQVRDRTKLRLQPSQEEGSDRVSASVQKDAITYKYKNVTMQRLADILSRETQRTVKDETGIDGAFDFELHAVRDPEEKNRFVAPLAPIISDLGLKLESRRGPMEFFVIDRAEHPSEN